MPDKPVLWKTTEKNIYYRIDALEAVCDRLIEELPWPGNIQTLSFLFSDYGPDEYLSLRRNISGRYGARLVYCADKEKLIAPEGAAISTNIRIKKAGSLDEIRQLYLSTVLRVFNEEFPGELPDSRIKFSENVARNYLSSEKSLCLAQGERVSGLVTVVGIKDHLAQPVDCVNWVWLDKSLRLPERIAAQGLIVEWLKRIVAQRVNCYIDSFNFRSQRFFRRIGFVPLCLNIERKS
ncbi:MAG: hypothetical protein HY550_05940 [Elusimicrobia bacterium]|nr:hypothetical protein [Elusimicrobiota bacterium]